MAEVFAIVALALAVLREVIVLIRVILDRKKQNRHS
jgi:hypothetical protein